jgi:hypothetical protein
MAGGEACGLRIMRKEMLDHAFLHGALSTNEEVGCDIPPHAQIGTEKFRRVSPQGFLSAETIFQPPYPDTVIFDVDVLHGQRRRFVDSQAIMINESEQGAVARRVNDFEEALELVLREVLRQRRHSVSMWMIEAGCSKASQLS